VFHVTQLTVNSEKNCNIRR